VRFFLDEKTGSGDLFESTGTSDLFNSDRARCPDKFPGVHNQIKHPPPLFLEFKFDNLILIAARCAVNTRYEICEQLLNKQLLNVDEVVDQQINFLNDKILLLIPVR